ncbi:MAG TPA: hypothetical protein VGG61_00425, partial [Gemmataceae bacterium]
MLLAQLIRQSATLLLTVLVVSLLVTSPLPAQSQASPATATSPAQRTFVPDPERAQKAVERGDRAEAEGRPDDALLAFDEAVRHAPQDLAIVARSATLRSKLVRTHVENAERLALAGDVTQATTELRAALRMDPTNSVVYERISQMEGLQGDDAVPPPQQQVQGLPRIKVQEGKHNFDLRGDTKSAYEQVATAFGIKAAFDPDLTSRSVRLRVQDVDYKTAMALLGQQTGTFQRPLNASLIFVAPDTAEKRREYGLQAVQTFLLPAAVAPEEMTELLRVLREITGSTRIELDSRTRTITRRDSLDRLQIAGNVIHQVEKARGEIMLDIELLEVDRNKATQLGITPPTSAQAFLISPSDVHALSQASDLANALTILGQLFAAKGLSSIPTFTVFGGGYSTFLLTMPALAANFSDALSLVQTGRQVLMRAQDGKPASFFVGDRFPVTLSLLSGSLGTGTGSAASLLSTPVPTSTTFPQTVFPVGNNPSAVVAATFSSGTLPDLAVANLNDNSISILLNQDKGNFVAQAHSPILLPATETGPIALASGLFGNT